MIAYAPTAPRLALIAIALIASASLLIGCPPPAAGNSGNGALANNAGSAGGNANTTGGNTNTDGGNTNTDGGNSGTTAPDPLAHLEGGNPLPEGTHNVVFHVFGKQSISFLSDASERIAGNVEFQWNEENGPPNAGTATFEVGADRGTGSASFTVPVHALRTGNTVRDEHLQSANWLNATANPTLNYTVTSLKRVRPTVWEVKGDWSMHGVTKPLSVHANVRFIEDWPTKDKDFVRVQCAFDIAIEDFGIANQSVGSPAVAKVWQVELALIGEIQE